MAALAGLGLTELAEALLLEAEALDLRVHRQSEAEGVRTRNLKKPCTMHHTPYSMFHITYIMHLTPCI